MAFREVSVYENSGGAPAVVDRPGIQGDRQVGPVDRKSVRRYIEAAATPARLAAVVDLPACTWWNASAPGRYWEFLPLLRPGAGGRSVPRPGRRRFAWGPGVGGPGRPHTSRSLQEHFGLTKAELDTAVRDWIAANPSNGSFSGVAPRR